MSSIDWSHRTEDRTCPTCHASLAEEVLAALRYTSQGFADHICPTCGALLSIQEE